MLSVASNMGMATVLMVMAHTSYAWACGGRSTSRLFLSLMKIMS